MEKILLAIDAVNPDTSAFNFACYVAGLTNSKLTGVFLENLVADYRPTLVASNITPYIDWTVDKDSPEYQEKQHVIESNIEMFRHACERRSLRYTVHHDRNAPAREIIEESRYADLLIVDAATSFEKRFEGTPTTFVKNVLSDAECPVIIAPESFDGIEEIVFAYNNTKSSVFAIKQFTYLFPMLNKEKVTLLQVNDQGVWADREKHNFSEWLHHHYPAIRFETLKGSTDEKLLDYLFMRKNVFIVMGAYGRSAVSRFFQRSHADRIIKTVIQPIFISHY